MRKSIIHQKKTKSNDENVHIQQKKTRVKIVGDSMLNSIEEKRMNKINHFHIKVCKYPGESSIDIINHLKPSLRKTPDEIIIHAETNDITNNVNYLSNVKKIVK